MTTADTYIHQVLDQLPRCTPRREQIATELRGHIAERTSSGQSEADVIRGLGDPLTLAESYLAAVPLVRASFGRRAIAKMLDALAFLALGIPSTWLLWRALPPEVAPFALLAGIVGTSALFAVYTIVAESRVGRTLGKHAVRLLVVRESGARISLGQSFVRQLPMFLEIFAIDALFALFTERHQRAFELLSKTRVVLVDREVV
jgi:uncharacterized RDD family membrane protein YckC